MRCPYCKLSDIWRLQPYPWMRRIRPRFKNRRCSNCGQEFAVWCGVPMKHTTGRKLAFLYVMLVVVLAILLCADLYRLYANPSKSWIHRGFEAVLNIKSLVAPRSGQPTVPDAAPRDLSNF